MLRNEESSIVGLISGGFVRLSARKETVWTAFWSQMTAIGLSVSDFACAVRKKNRKKG